MRYGTAQADAEHTLELMDRQFERASREHAAGHSTGDELEQARMDADEAWLGVEVERMAKVARATAPGCAADAVARAMVGVMGLGVV